MKKYFLHIAGALICATIIGACSTEEDDLFSESAAMRLQNFIADYSNTLTDQGGLWSMEYFCNTTEPGYVFVMQFDKNGSVEVSGQNEALDLKFKTNNKLVSDRSSWELITDCGPVLTFNTFNKVFHEFSDPSDIKDGKINPDTGYEVDETGYGHRGDYEFKIISRSDDGNKIKMKGKKTGYYIYMHRLPATTDVKTFLDNVRQQPLKIFDKRFPLMILTDNNTGEEFVVLNAHTSYITAYPCKGDSISQCSFANALITEKGIRFREPFAIQRADRSAAMAVIENLLLQPDGSLCDDNGMILTGQSPVNLLQDNRYSWEIDLNSFTGKFAEPFKTMTSDLHAKWSGKRDLNAIKFCFRQSGGIMRPTLYYELGSNQAIFYLDYSAEGKTKLSWTVKEYSKDVDTFAKNVASLGVFFQLVNSCSFELSLDNLVHTSTIKFTDATDASSSFIANVK